VVRGGAGARTIVVPIAWPAESADPTAAIASALREIGRRLADGSARPARVVAARIALLPPFSDARLVALPPLRRAEAESVLRRDAARHFVGANVARIVAVRQGAGGRPALAAAAPSPLVEAVRAAVAAAGWRLEAILPAHACWLAAAPRAPLAGVVAVEGATAHVLRVERDAVTVLRRVPAAAADVVAALGQGPGALASFGDADGSERIVRAASAAGWQSPDDAGASSDAARAAAEGAFGARLELVPATLAAERRRAGRALAARLAVAATVLLVLAAAVELWGARRELAALADRRAEIRAQVAPLLATRDSINRLYERAEAIGALTARAPRYTSALFDLALLLPADAHLTALDASGDTVKIEAAGARAGAAMQALRDAGSLSDVRLLGIVERELEDGTTAVERFTLTGRIATEPRERKPAARAATRAPESHLARRQP
jgi:hypothetical protein